MVARFCVRPTSEKWFWETIQVTMERGPSQCCVDFTSILHLLTLLVPQAQCGVNLDQLYLFHL